jgi:MoaA/NifB/PqqE/SkfB family radical SAM enzyme
LDIEHWRRIITEATSLGVFSFIIAGGEPFLQPGLVELCGEFKDRIFIIVTNGTTISWKDLRALKRSTNIIVLVSIEGGKELTDARRGMGVYDKVMTTVDGLWKVGTPFGVTITVTRRNYSYWMDPKHIDMMVKKGALVGVFIEYIPVGDCKGCSPLLSENPIGWDLEDDSELVLNCDERSAFRSRMLEYRETKPLYLINSPGDEEMFGGCVSAGRGFAHVTPHGDLTPCPISNIATHNLTRSSLQDGLASSLFVRIRESEGLLENEGTPCALFAHPDEVDALAKEVGAYRTDAT